MSYLFHRLFLRFHDLVLGLKVMVANRKLCEAPYNKTVDWSRWYIFWADERVVAKSHADSNYKLAKDGLLSKVVPPIQMSPVSHCFLCFHEEWFILGIIWRRVIYLWFLALNCYLLIYLLSWLLYKGKKKQKWNKHIAFSRAEVF